MIELTTDGMNGGVIFLAIRSSQLIGEKKEWYFSSSWRGKNRKEIFDQHTQSKHTHRTFSPVIFFACITYKVILHSEPLGAVLLQKALQQLPASVRHVGFEHWSLVQDVVVHLSRVATVKRGL